MSEDSPKPNDGDETTDELEPPTPQPGPQPATAERGSVTGLRVALWWQLAVTVFGAPLVYPITLAFAAMSGYTTEDLHSFTAGYIAFIVLPSTMHLLAVIQVGRTVWGALYLTLSMFATGIQIVMLLPWFVVPAAPFILALIIELVSLANRDTWARIGTGSSPRRSALPELIVIPLAIAVFAGLMVLNGKVHDVENRHPARDFNGSEAPAVLAEAIEEPRQVLEGIDGFPEGKADGIEDSPCNDGAGWDDEWSEYEFGYWYEGLSPNSGAGLEALETMRGYLPEHGWEITRDEPWGHSHQLSAQRDDGVKLSLDVGGNFMTFDVNSGCVENAETAVAD